MFFARCAELLLMQRPGKTIALRPKRYVNRKGSTSCTGNLLRKQKWGDLLLSAAGTLHHTVYTAEGSEGPAPAVQLKGTPRLYFCNSAAPQQALLKHKSFKMLYSCLCSCSIWIFRDWREPSHLLTYATMPPYIRLNLMLLRWFASVRSCVVRFEQRSAGREISGCVALLTSRTSLRSKLS